jgi:hypothetical protein
MGCNSARPKSTHEHHRKDFKRAPKGEAVVETRQKQPSFHDERVSPHDSIERHASRSPAKVRAESPTKLQRHESTKVKEKEEKGMVRKITDSLGITHDKTKDYEYLSALLKKHNIDDDPHLGDHYTLYLDLEDNQAGVHNFLKEAENIKLERFKKVSI